MEFKVYPWCDFIHCEYNLNGQCHGNYHQCLYTRNKMDNLMNNMNFGGNGEVICPYCGKRFKK